MAMQPPAEPDPDEPIEAEVVRSPAPNPKQAERLRTFFHPLSGLVILGVDWLAFGIELPTQLLLGPIVSAAAFAVTFWAVSKIQQREGDEPRWAVFKALLGGLAAGVPFPITGTVVGTAIIVLSGLPRGKRAP
jgi:hypothetical protein